MTLGCGVWVVLAESMLDLPSPLQGPLAAAKLHVWAPKAVKGPMTRRCGVMTPVAVGICIMYCSNNIDKKMPRQISF